MKEVRSRVWKRKSGTLGMAGKGHWDRKQEEKGIETRVVGVFRHRDKSRAGEQILGWSQGEGN